MVAAFMFGMIALAFYVIYEATFTEIKEEKERRLIERDESGE